MTKLSIAFLAAMALVSFGCKKKSSGGEAIAKMTEFKDRMCACKDKACTENVAEEMTRWSQANAKGEKEVKMSEEDMKKSTAIGEELTRCMTKILTESAGAGGAGAAGGTPPPPAGGSGEGAAAAPPASGSGDGSAAAGSAK